MSSLSCDVWDDERCKMLFNLSIESMLLPDGLLGLWWDPPTALSSYMSSESRLPTCLKMVWDSLFN